MPLHKNSTTKKGEMKCGQPEAYSRQSSPTPAHTILVCGGRNYWDHTTLFCYLDELHAVHPVSRVIEGGAEGADYLANLWALVNNIYCRTERANWKAYGLAAGPIRNKIMASLKPDLVIAFPGGRGTANMIDVAMENNIPVEVI
jgi:hypothetical protein